MLQKPVDEATFETVTAPLFDYLDQLNPLLWRSGRAFPQNYPAMRQLLADGEVDIIFAFNPAEASSAIASGELPDTVRSFTFPGGTLANTHFVAIPYNANAKAGALVLADFLLSPEAQARKQDPKVWGDPTVLADGQARAARTAPASPRSTSASRRCRQTSSARRLTSRIRAGWTGSRRNGSAAMARRTEPFRAIRHDRPRGRMADRVSPPLTARLPRHLLTLPILAGLAGTVLPAFGYLPALGGEGFSLEPWRMLLAAARPHDVGRSPASRRASPPRPSRLSAVHAVRCRLGGHARLRAASSTSSRRCCRCRTRRRPSASPS